jgi:Leucine-rich repeat (LRR) protein
MTTLDLSNNNLTVVPDLSGYPDLAILYLNNNLLTDVGILPSTLTELYLQDNFVEAMVVPPNLTTLNVLNNNLTMLSIPPSLTVLTATLNDTNVVNELPTSIMRLAGLTGMNLTAEYKPNSIDIFLSPL